jgi:hypothetical protein
MQWRTYWPFEVRFSNCADYYWCRTIFYLDFTFLGLISVYRPLIIGLRRSFHRVYACQIWWYQSEATDIHCGGSFMVYQPDEWLRISDLAPYRLMEASMTYHPTDVRMAQGVVII